MADIASQGLWPLIGLVFASLKSGQIPPIPIVKALISKALGLGIVAGSTLVKLPQVLNVVGAKSAEGLNPLSFELETLGLAIASTYGFVHNLAFSAFGESVAILIQNIFLLILIYHYQRRSVGRSLLLILSIIAWTFVSYTGVLQPSHLSALYDANNFILLAARLPQIAQNHLSKSTGQLSIITYSLNLAGTAARIFTTLQEKNAGTAMLRGAIISTGLNAIMVAQIIKYKGKKPKAE